ncbi:MAG: PilZ domain-containing protein [Archangium sp.]
MLVEQQKRASRVRFKHPVRVVTLDGQPRVIRTLAANVSHKGMFVRMPEPLPMGTRVALSLEAGGRALALAQAEVVWARAHESQLPGRFAGCGVRFTDFLHPRAQDLVGYLVDNLDRGKPLQAAPAERPLPRWLPLAAGLALLCCALGAVLIFHDWSADSAQVAELDEEIEAENAEPIALVMAAPPVVKSAALAAATQSPVGAADTAPSQAVIAKSPAESTSDAQPELAKSPSAEPTLADPSSESPSAAPPEVAKSASTEQPGPSASPSAKGTAQPNASPSVEPSSAVAPPSGAQPVVVKSTGASTASPADIASPPAVAKSPGASPTASAPVSPSSAITSPAAVAKSTGASPTSAPPAAASAPSTESPALARVAQSPSSFPTTTASVVQPVLATSPSAAPRVKSASPAGKADSLPTGRVAAAGEVPLPQSATDSLRWSSSATTLKLQPAGTITRAFVLLNPARAVFDVSGATPARSHTLSSTVPHTQAIRIGKLPAGTRVVIDLDEAPRSSKQDGDALVLSF